MGKFIKLYESAIQRFTRGGFLIGDLVKLKEGAFNDEFFKNQGVNYTEKLKEFTNSGLNIRVSAVKASRPSYQPGNIQNEASDFLVDIVLERAPGLYYEFVTVPARVLEHIDTGINLAPVPDSLKRPNNEVIDPEEVNLQSSNTYMSPSRTRTADQGDGKDSKSDVSLLNKNVSIPSSPAENERDPASYTARYMPKKRG